MFGCKCRDRDLFALINDSGFDFVGVDFPSIREATLVSVGIRVCLDIDAISLQDVLGHRLQPGRTVDLERHCPT